ncbi:MAG: tagaturonate epimerase family protein [Opitutales bacterium]
MKKLPRFTFGMGDRFGHQGSAQLQVVLDGRARGIDVAPVWNKSKREHTLIGSEPQSLREEADAAVSALSYDGAYFVDADHVNFDTVDDFIACSDFFTLDVAEQLGQPPLSEDKADAYALALSKIDAIPGFEELNMPIYAPALIRSYGGAVEAAGRLYRKIKDTKGDNEFAIEVSMDETDQAQLPNEMLGILCMLSAEGVPAQTIAPKFSGRFNKGVDYVGDLAVFTKEFEDDLRALAFAVKHFELPETLKLSVHSGSDKFSLYPIIRDLVEKYNAGLHLKTAGTTWLEEAIGLAEAGDEGVSLVASVYAEAMGKLDELTGPYATVLDIDLKQLPSVEETKAWTSEQWVNALDHDPTIGGFNSSMRQLFHVSFKLVAKNSNFYELLKEHADIINRRVHQNLFNKHLLRIFPAEVSHIVEADAHSSSV